MKSPDAVLNQLAKLYDFYREIARFKLKGERKSSRAAPRDRESGSLISGGRTPR